MLCTPNLSRSPWLQQLCNVTDLRMKLTFIIAVSITFYIMKKNVLLMPQFNIFLFLPPTALVSYEHMQSNKYSFNHLSFNTYTNDQEDNSKNSKQSNFRRSHFFRSQLIDCLLFLWRSGDYWNLKGSFPRRRPKILHLFITARSISSYIAKDVFLLVNSNSCTL